MKENHGNNRETRHTGLKTFIKPIVRCRMGPPKYWFSSQSIAEVSLTCFSCFNEKLQISPRAQYNRRGSFYGTNPTNMRSNPLGIPGAMLCRNRNLFTVHLFANNKNTTVLQQSINNINHKSINGLFLF